jgi:hypothetical protein
MGVAMSAMPALDWPEDDATGQTAYIWPVPAQVARTETAHDQSARHQPARDHTRPGAAVHVTTAPSPAVRHHTRPSVAARGTAASPQADRTRAVRGQAPHGNAAPAPLRLTRRGRIVIAAAAALVVALLSLLVTGQAWATGHSAPPRGADRSLGQVVVLPGQSLWSVAQSADPNADPRLVMQQIVELNGLTGDTLQSGQRLWVPRG